MTEGGVYKQVQRDRCRCAHEMGLGTSTRKLGQGHLLMRETEGIGLPQRLKKIIDEKSGVSLWALR